MDRVRRWEEVRLADRLADSIQERPEDPAAALEAYASAVGR
jgi:hypothetical protein